MNCRWEDIETLALKFLRGCYFTNIGTPLPQDAHDWARDFDQDPRERILEWQRAIGPTLVTEGGLPFWFSLAIGNEAKASAWFVLWDFYVLMAAANLPEPPGDES